MAGHGLEGPRSEEEFKEYLKTSETAGVKLKRMNISQDSIDDIFVSDRDGEPFKIRYGVKGMADHAVIFESIGVDGKRLVAYGEPIELDDAAYEKAWEGKTKADDGMEEMLKDNLAIHVKVLPRCSRYGEYPIRSNFSFPINPLSRSRPRAEQCA